MSLAIYRQPRKALPNPSLVMLQSTGENIMMWKDDPLPDLVNSHGKRRIDYLVLGTPGNRLCLWPLTSIQGSGVGYTLNASLALGWPL
jgi:hypothetical protein